MKTITIIAVALFIAGCEKTGDKDNVVVSRTIIDQCLRTEIFKACLKLLPVGPATTKYNDWDEVVSECSSVAYHQAFRYREHVKPECMAE